MKINLIIVFLTLSNLLYSQIPLGYYDNAIGLSEAPLKSALHNIIKGHTQFPYTSTSTDVWDILKQTDKDPNDSNNVILLYTGWSVDAAQEWNSGGGWSREHVWSKSHGAFGTMQGAGTDAHHLRPADPSVNSAKNNRWFDTCSTPYLDNGVYTGCFKGSTDWVWQPRDEVKGDVARMIFYMATRYEGDIGEPDLELIDFLPIDNNTSDSVYAKLSTLLQWNNEDTVDSWERNRNNIIYYDFQNNRNPFIDHPEFVNLIWSNTTEVSEVNKIPQFNIYPNPVNDSFVIDVQGYVEYIEVIDLSGKTVRKIDNLKESKIVDLKGLETGVYIIKVYNEKGFTSTKIIKE